MEQYGEAFLYCIRDITNGDKAAYGAAEMNYDTSEIPLTERTKKGRKEAFHLTEAMEQQIVFVTETTISEFVASINALRDEKTMKRLTIKSITEELLAEGYLEQKFWNGYSRTFLTEKGEALGIRTEERESQSGNLYDVFYMGKGTAVSRRTAQIYSGLMPANPFQMQDSVNKSPKMEVKYKNSNCPVLCILLLQMRGMERYFRSKRTIPQNTSTFVRTSYSRFPVFPGRSSAIRGNTSPRIRLLEMCRRRLCQIEYSMAMYPRIRPAARANGICAKFPCISAKASEDASRANHLPKGSRVFKTAPRKINSSTSGATNPEYKNIESVAEPPVAASRERTNVKPKCCAPVSMST